MGIAGYIPGHPHPASDEEGAMGSIGQGTQFAYERPWQSGEPRNNGGFAGLLSLTQQLSETNDVQHILDMVLRSTVEMLRISSAHVLLHQPNGFTHRAAYFLPGYTHPLPSKRLESAAAQAVYQRLQRKDQPIVLSRRSGGEHPEDSQVFGLAKSQSICLLSLKAGEEMSGVMLLSEHRDVSRDPFNEWNLHLAAMIAQQTANAIQRIRMRHTVENHLSESVEALMRIMDARDGEIGMHSERLVSLSDLLARKMGYSAEDLQVLHWAAFLHDIGKIAVPHEVLYRPGPLTDEDWELVKRHPNIGADIISSVTGLSKVAAIVRAHHEAFDGSGYPMGLAGDDIPQEARILAVVDSYAAMTEGRVYQNARSSQEVLAELSRCSGTKYDPKIVDLFINLISHDNAVV